jgi:hypothetical protein
MEAIRQAVEHNPISNFIPLTVAILLLFFWVAFGRFDLSGGIEINPWDCPVPEPNDLPARRLQLKSPANLSQQNGFKSKLDRLNLQFSQDLLTDPFRSCDLSTVRQRSYSGMAGRVERSKGQAGIRYAERWRLRAAKALASADGNRNPKWPSGRIRTTPPIGRPARTGSTSGS